MTIIEYMHNKQMRKSGQSCTLRAKKPVFRIRDVYPGSESRNLSILTHNIVSKLSEIWSGLFILDLDPES